MERGGLTLSKKFLGLTAKQTCWEKKEYVIYAQYLNHRLSSNFFVPMV